MSGSKKTKANSFGKNLEKKVEELTKQVKALQKDVSTSKLVEKLEQSYENLLDKKLKEFEKRTTSIFDQAKTELIKVFPGAKKIVGAPAEKKAEIKKKPARKAPAKKPAKTSTAKVSTAKAVTKTKTTNASKAVQKKAPAKKAPAKKPVAKAPAKAEAKKVVKVPASELVGVKGIGPASIKKLNDAGITTLAQLANPSDEQQEALKTTRGFSNWVEKAKSLAK